MKIKKTIILLLINALCMHVNGQTSISDYVDVSLLRNQGIKAINLFSVDGSKKVLIERNEFNLRGMLLKKIVYCDFLNDPTDKIEMTSNKYDKSDTILVGTSYGHKKGDTIDLVFSNKFSYVFKSNNQIFKKRTIDSVDKDIEEETFYYNDAGRLYEKRTDFYNETGDTVKFYFTNKYEHDASGNVLKNIFISGNKIEYERIFTYDPSGNLLTYNYIGGHIDGFDIDRYRFVYNKYSKPSLKEVCYVSGDKCQYRYSYNKDRQLIKVLVLKNELKDKHYKRFKGTGPPPPPEVPGKNDYKRIYRKDYEYHCSYDNSGHLIKVMVKHNRIKVSESFLLVYE